ncbi:MAG TPA: low molecular weight phosphotyrosine protein phosphatase [Gammaproteobacteria bacterium]|nr:low molecular weight phosphotyrosine protein phosphatase [Gammaproteobacteria bacterium]
MALFRRSRKKVVPEQDPADLVRGRKVSILFVCMGNICRSPTAQGVFTHLVKEQGLRDVIGIDSAGTVSYHVGRAPDSRAQKAAEGRGYDLSEFRARLVSAKDCELFDYILVMDETNLLDVRSVVPKSCWNKIHMFMDFDTSGRKGREVPDPYSGGANDFERVLDLVEKAASGLLEHIKVAHSL